MNYFGFANEYNHKTSPIPYVFINIGLYHHYTFEEGSINLHVLSEYWNCDIVDLSLKTFALILFNVYLKSTKFHVLYVCPNLVPDI
jgi:hypothetical protein